MSYTLSLTAAKTDLQDETSAVTEAIDAYDPPGPAVDEAREHLAKIAEAARLLASVIGVDGDELSISTSGHANKGHGHAVDWGAEFITLTVGVIPPVAQRPGA